MVIGFICCCVFFLAIPLCFSTLLLSLVSETTKHFSEKQDKLLKRNTHSHCSLQSSSRGLVQALLSVTLMRTLANAWNALALLGIQLLDSNEGSILSPRLTYKSQIRLRLMISTNIYHVQDTTLDAKLNNLKSVTLLILKNTILHIIICRYIV